ncbi:DegT/DnrJ/EryC1/StrS family aminotransferase [Alteromonas macleodii]|uniref:DegT/DnrJ/EryC1/StrS family aminotransferase n=1 Tax=Alteromonas macleodii TaxID=28108 RepID=UPI003BF8483F
MVESEFIPISQPFIDEKAKRYVSECLDTGWISSQGAYVTQFEQAFAKYIGVNYAVSVTSGTAALHLALLAMGVSAGDEVIVPDLTFAATANAVLLCGATPVLCSVDKATWTLDIDDCAQLISRATKAIIPVHLYGNPADMRALVTLSKEHNIVLVEDCAESLGATVDGHHTGTFGDIGCFSFFANKLLSTGEGGMLTTNSEHIAKKIRVLRDHGMSPTKKYWHEHAGLNYRMTNIQAAIGVTQLDRLDEFILARRDQELQYRSRLQGISDIVFKQELPGAISVNWLFSFCFLSDDNGEKVEALRAWLRENHVDSRPFFFPLHEQPPYKDERFVLSQTKLLSNSGMSLPTFIGLKESQIDRVCDLVVEFMHTYRED